MVVNVILKVIFLHHYYNYATLLVNLCELRKMINELRA